jgi:hypothetical protein
MINCQGDEDEPAKPFTCSEDPVCLCVTLPVGGLELAEQAKQLNVDLMTAS